MVSVGEYIWLASVSIYSYRSEYIWTPRQAYMSVTAEAYFPLIEPCSGGEKPVFASHVLRVCFNVCHIHKQFSVIVSSGVLQFCLPACHVPKQFSVVVSSDVLQFC